MEHGLLAWRSSKILWMTEDIRGHKVCVSEIMLHSKSEHKHMNVLDGVNTHFPVNWVM